MGLDIDCGLALARNHHPNDQSLMAFGQETRVTTPWCIFIAPVGMVNVTQSGHCGVADSFPTGDVAGGQSGREKGGNASSLLRRDFGHGSGNRWERELRTWAISVIDAMAVGCRGGPGVIVESEEV